MPEETINHEDDAAQPEDIHSFPVNLPHPDFPIELGNHRMVGSPSEQLSTSCSGEFTLVLSTS